MENEKIHAEKVNLAVEHLEGKWSVKAIVSIVNRGEASFSDIKSDLSGISNKVLSDTLKNLRESGIVRKRNGGYVVTSRGERIIPVLELLEEWAADYLVDPKEKVLIAERNEDRAGMYAKWLKEDYEVLVATSRSEAVNILDSSVDVVLLDFDMDSSLDKLAEKIMELTGAKVVALNGDAHRDFNVSVADVLSKPLDRENLRKAITGLKDQ